MRCRPGLIHPSREPAPVFLALLIAVSIAARAAFAGSEAESILKTTGVTGGIVVVMGCEDQELLAGLRVNDRYLVHGLDTSSSLVDKVRTELHAKHLYGPISVTTLDGATLPYVDNLVTLLVAQHPGNVARDEIMRVLAPYGVAVMAGETLVKPWPKGMDQWTHTLHGPDNNPVAKDELVAPPRHLRWTCDPLWARHHDEPPSTSDFVSSHGRIFYIIDETPIGFGSAPETWTLVARNAFNGMLLWKKPIPIGEWGNSAWSQIQMGGYYGRFEHPRLDARLVAVDNTVYVTLGYNAPVTVLDADTGQAVYTYSDSPYVDEIALAGDTLFISAYNMKREPVTSVRHAVSLQKTVKAYDIHTRTLVWASQPYTGINPKADHLAGITHLFMTIGSQHVFVVDRGDVVALDKLSGKEAWRSAMPAQGSATVGYGFNSRGMCGLIAADGTLLVLQMAPDGYPGKKGKLTLDWRAPNPALAEAYDIENGKPLWQMDIGYWSHHAMPEAFVIDRLAWLHDREDRKINGVDLQTGEVKSGRDTTDAFTNGHHHRCYQNKATTKYLITSYRGLEYLPWDSTTTDHNHWVRSSCQVGMFPCNGLSYALPHACDCYITSKLTGVLALAGKQDDDISQISQRLVTGPAYGHVEPAASIPDLKRSWPTYRHDPERSSYIPVDMPSALKASWRADLRARALTSPVVSDGLLLVGAKDTHTIYALDIATGEQRWHYTAHGPIDSPPTVYKGLTIVGSRAGWVYCLRVTDGALVWRFRAAPKDRLICACGRLESSWPVHGSVLVEKDNAYVVAGRSSYLDGGFYKYRIDPFTGEVFEEGIVKSDAGAKADSGRFPTVDYGVVSDILVKSGESIFMRQRRLFGAEYTGAVWGKGLASSAGLLDDSWCSRTGQFLDGIPFGSLIAFSEDTVFAIRAYKEIGAHPLFRPGQGKYLLTATDRHPELPQSLKYDEWISPKSSFPEKNRWQRNEVVRITCMALTRDFLYAAGTRDVIDQGSDPWATYRGEEDGVLMCVSTGTGETVFKTELRRAPVYDGMAVVEGAVFLCLRDGSVICLGTGG